MKIVTAAIALLAIVVAFSTLFALPFMWLWNFAVVQAVTFANPIGFWVAWALMFFLGAFVSGARSSSSN